jgi:hypothetical protein
MPSASAITVGGGGSRIQTLYAGQNIPVGTVEVWNDGDALHITYRITAPWKMSESHLMVAASLSGIPQTAKGNPIPGKFTWSQTYDQGVSGSEFVISLSENDLESTFLFVAAHAVVTNGGQTETAWAQGHAFDGKNWATLFTYQVEGIPLTAP